MTAAVVIVGWGNPSRGDDALGPLFCQRLGDWLAAAGLTERCEIVEDFQLQVEHALDLAERHLVLFVDAVVDHAAGTPYEFRVVTARRDASHTTHALSPEAVLAVYELIRRQPPPPAFLLGICGQSFELGAGLSAAAEAHLDAACRFAETLMSRPSVEVWASFAATPAAAAQAPPRS